MGGISINKRLAGLDQPANLLQPPEFSDSFNAMTTLMVQRTFPLCRNCQVLLHRRVESSHPIRSEIIQTAVSWIAD